MDLDYVDNLLLNMSAGLLPCQLNERDVKALKERFGENWFKELGYNEEQYSKPNFEEKQNG